MIHMPNCPYIYMRLCPLKFYLRHFLSSFYKFSHPSPRPGSNRSPLPYQGSALPTELRGQYTHFWSGKRGSNPRPSAWKADALPTELLPLIKPFILRGEDSNLRRLAPSDLQSDPFGRLGTSPRAGDGIRTRDLLITNQLLYQLSYASKNFC